MYTFEDQPLCFSLLKNNKKPKTDGATILNSDGMHVCESNPVEMSPSHNQVQIRRFGTRTQFA